MKTKSKKTLFTCQITENYIKVAKFLISQTKREFNGSEIKIIPAGTSDKNLTESIIQLLKKLGFNKNPIIVSLPRNFATCRYLKLPTQSSPEIEKIISLQASRYLPYPAHELITGYQIISTNKEGFSYINLVIVHSDVSKRYINIFETLKPSKLSILLSSIGLSNLYTYLKPEDPSPAIIIDVDSNNVEVTVVAEKKLYFSRYFKFNNQQAGWEKLFLDEINKSRAAYLKELTQSPPNKIIILGGSKITQEIATILKNEVGLQVEFLAYDDKVDSSEVSFASLIGLGMVDTEESLNLLPLEVKEKIKRVSQYKDRLRIGLFILGILVMWFLTVAKNLDNKSAYLGLLKKELNKISKEAKPLENLEKRLLAIINQGFKKTSVLDILHELYKILPEEVFLIKITYEEHGPITLHGQAQKLNYVFSFVSQIEKSTLFKKFEPKVRYATKKKTLSGEVVDFEIVCSRR